MYLLNGEIGSKLVTKNWNIVNDQSNANYSLGNQISYSAEVLKSNLSDYILVRGDINIIGRNLSTKITFKNCAPFIKCIRKNDATKIDNAENWNLVMPVYNLLEHGSNYSETTGSLRFYSKDEATNLNAEIEDDNTFKSFRYETKLLENTEADRSNEILNNCCTIILSVIFGDHLEWGWLVAT